MFVVVDIGAISDRVVRWEVWVRLTDTDREKIRRTRPYPNGGWPGDGAYMFYGAYMTQKEAIAEGAAASDLTFEWGVNWMPEQDMSDYQAKHSARKADRESVSS